MVGVEDGEADVAVEVEVPVPEVLETVEDDDPEVEVTVPEVDVTVPEVEVEVPVVMVAEGPLLPVVVNVHDSKGTSRFLRRLTPSRTETTFPSATQKIEIGTTTPSPMKVKVVSKLHSKN